MLGASSPGQLALAVGTLPRVGVTRVHDAAGLLGAITKQLEGRLHRLRPHEVGGGQQVAAQAFRECVIRL